MKPLYHLRNAVSGWIAGLIVTYGFSWLWHLILPVEGQSVQRPTFWMELLIILGLVSPFAIAGGIIGGRLPREGGVSQQVLYAALLGSLLILPVACFLFWYLAW
jgi:hypothetical protein